jgi:hypothetical protein
MMIKKTMLFISETYFVSCGAENMKCYFPMGLPKSLNCQDEIQTGTVSMATNIFNFLSIQGFFLMVRGKDTQ